MTERDEGFEEERSSDPRFPLPAEEPTRGPVDYDFVSGVSDRPETLSDPTRRKHPTILSEEGEEEAPQNELRPAPRPELGPRELAGNTSPEREEG